MTNEQHADALRYEVSVLKTMLQPHDTGHIHTAIAVLEDRIRELDGWDYYSDLPSPKSYVIMDREDYRLVLDISEVISPKNIYSIEMTGIQFRDGVETTKSTYDFFLDKQAIDKLIEGLKDYTTNTKTKPSYPDDIELSKAKCRIEIDSPYNDGYTKEFYRKELDRLNVMYEST